MLVGAPIDGNRAFEGRWPPWGGSPDTLFTSSLSFSEYSREIDVSDGLATLVRKKVQRLDARTFVSVSGPIAAEPSAAGRVPTNVPGNAP